MQDGTAAVKAEDVRQIAAWLEAAGLSQLTLTTPQSSLRLELGARPAPSTAQPPAASAAPSLLARATGVFLPAHPWSDTPLAVPGRRVRAGDVVALLRAGPLYQPVTATADGVLGRCLAEPGGLVDFGRPLMEFLPDTSHETRSA